MLSTAPLLETSLEGLTLNRRGKVRDVYDVTLPSGEPALLIVATDRISAFDYVLGSGIPDKGKVLTQLSGFWFERMGDLVPHHLHLARRRRVPGAGAAASRTSSAAGRCWRGGPTRSRSSAWRADISRARAGRNISRPAASAASSCRRPARIGSAAGADLHAGDQGRQRPRHQHQRGGSRTARRHRSHRAAESADARDLPPRLASTPSRRASSSPTPSSSSGWSAPAIPRPTSSSSTKC